MAHSESPTALPAMRTPSSPYTPCHHISYQFTYYILRMHLYIARNLFSACHQDKEKKYPTLIPSPGYRALSSDAALRDLVQV